MSINQIIGHSSQIKIMRQSLQKGALAHAYLFTGPSGIGKETFAVELAKTLNCEQNKSDACDDCPVCKRIGENTFPDHFHIVPAGASLTIKIEDILNLQKKLNLSRFEGKAKTILIADADRLNDASSNALLKILEEPMPQTYFFLISSNPEGILATIRSRCRQLQFFPLQAEEVGQCLQKAGIDDPKRREDLSRLSEGSVERALRLNEEQGSRLRQSLLKFALSPEVSVSDALFLSEQMIKAVNEDKSCLWDILEILQGIYRDLTAIKAGSPESVLLNPDWIKGMKLRSQNITIEQLDERVHTIERLRADFHRNTPVKFGLDYLFLYLSGKNVVSESRVTV